MAQRLYLSPPHMSGTEQVLVAETFASNWIAPIGPMLDQFEHDLAHYTGVAHVVALSSGTAALHLALEIAGVGAGDSVWGSTMTFIGGVGPIRYCGATPVFVDVDPASLLIDLDALETALTRAQARGHLPKAVISTDIYGNVVDIERMRDLRERFGFVWISDTAEALGSKQGAAHAGAGADFVILSFNGNKIITTSGGGALASDNKAAIDRARFLSTQAREAAPHYEHKVVGYNYRLSNVCAAIGVGQLRVIEARVARRREIFECYRARLAELPGVRFISEPPGMRYNRWLTTISIDPAQAGFSREDVRLNLERLNIESRPLWKPMHMQPVFAHCETLGGSVAEKAFEQGLCLPSGSAMVAHDIDSVTHVIMELAYAQAQL